MLCSPAKERGFQPQFLQTSWGDISNRKEESSLPDKTQAEGVMNFKASAKIATLCSDV